jgi:hypothetical protein
VVVEVEGDGLLERKVYLWARERVIPSASLSCEVLLVEEEAAVVPVRLAVPRRVLLLLLPLLVLSLPVPLLLSRQDRGQWDHSTSS